MDKHASAIAVRGARVNNLKGVCAEFPKGALTVVTGPAGSGKRSLAFGTLFAEGQRRYVETFSTYARQFLDQVPAPDVDSVDSVPPAIAIDRANAVHSPRSTVGTLTEVSDGLRILFANDAVPVCPACGAVAAARTPDALWRDLVARALAAGNPRLAVCFRSPVPEGKTRQECEAALAASGFAHFYGCQEPGAFYVAADRFRAASVDALRGVEAVTQCLSHGVPRIEVLVLGDDGGIDDVWPMTTQAECPECGRRFGAPTASLFGFNSAEGACPICIGTGIWAHPDPKKIVRMSRFAGRKTFSLGFLFNTITGRDALARYRKALRNPLEDDPAILLHGNLDEPFAREVPADRWFGLDRYAVWVVTRPESADRQRAWEDLKPVLMTETCPACRGTRHSAQALAWHIRTPQGLRNLADIESEPLERLAAFFETLNASEFTEPGQAALREIRERLAYLVASGLGYLALSRPSSTLSGGEIQRINLTKALGSRLSDTLFVLNEPSVGLHPVDLERLTVLLKDLARHGNAVVAIDSDPQVIAAASHVIELGPEGGPAGGQVVFEGTPQALLSEQTATAKALKAPLPPARGRHPSGWITVEGASLHNLKNITARFPKGAVTAVTGVSGSGKTSLVQGILVQAARLQAEGRPDPASIPARVEGLQSFARLEVSGQQFSTLSPHTCIAGACGAYEPLRKLFARMAHSSWGRFHQEDFNYASRGACPVCQGRGCQQIDLQFLGTARVPCPECQGTRFSRFTLDAKLALAGKSLSIADALALTASQAADLFSFAPEVSGPLASLAELGLGHLPIGREMASLAQGEVQLVRLAGLLARSAGGSLADLLVVLDEPTAGLHFTDVARLAAMLSELAGRGATVIAVEHNQQLIAACDWIVDLGPGAGDRGGTLLYQGSVAEISSVAESRTGQALLHPQPLACGSEPACGAPAAARSIVLAGAREHNLKDITVSVPKNALTVVSGVSGSGKSTLAFGILFAEGRRRYLENIGAYARMRVSPPPRPDVSRIENIPPTVAVEQHTSRGSLKSTVATMTEIHSYLRLLWSRFSDPVCAACGAALRPRTPAEALEAVLADYPGLFATVVRRQSLMSPQGRYGLDFLEAAARLGASRVRLGGQWMTPVRAESLIAQGKVFKNCIDIPVDTLQVTIENRGRLAAALTVAQEPHPGEYPAAAVLVGSLSHSRAAAAKAQRADEVAFGPGLPDRCPHCFSLLEVVHPQPSDFAFTSPQGACSMCGGTGLADPEHPDTSAPCPVCGGSRLKDLARGVRFGGLRLPELTRMPVSGARKAVESLRAASPAGPMGDVCRELLDAVAERLACLTELGLGYLTLDRSAITLSGGETQRVNLAGFIGSPLPGACYVLDEPTIGLHARDNARLVAALKALRDAGSTVVVVEHDEETIRAADHVIDIGPGAGRQGGTVVAEGPLEAIIANPASVTGRMLARSRTSTPPLPCGADVPRMAVQGATWHNMADLSVEFPLGRIVAVTGVSGSGKSSLVRGVLLPALQRKLAERAGKAAGDSLRCQDLSGWESLERVLVVDQAPIGRTQRSCPATYVEVLGPIRDLFAKSEGARMLGYTPGRFTFNRAEGQCPACEGRGVRTVSMGMMPSMEVACEACRGSRFNPSTLQVRWKGRTIGDVLAMTVDEALAFFADVPKIAGPLKLMADVGLGYLTLGQPTSTLSGGEAQRIKLVFELGKTAGRRTLARIPKTLYVLDEPTVGLHMADVQRLVAVMRRLVAAGHSLIVVEHNLDVVASADWIVDLGPEGGDAGGTVCGQGAPSTVAALDTPTGRALRAFLGNPPSRPRTEA